jgi:nucleoside 2-deoxyribosyltransferase
MTNRLVSIYLAGPEVFRLDAVTYGQSLVAFCDRNGAIGQFPLDHEARPGPGETLPMAISRVNEQLIRECDAVVANMDSFRGPSMDVGTAYEMGFGRALNKIVVGYTSDRTPYLEKVRRVMPLSRDASGYWRDAGGMQVESFDGEPLIDNLMMAADPGMVLGSFEAAVGHVLKLWIGRAGRRL